MAHSTRQMRARGCTVAVDAYASWPVDGRIEAWIQDESPAAWRWLLNEFCRRAAGDGGLCCLKGAYGWQPGAWPQRLLGEVATDCACQRRERFPANGAARP